MADNTISHYTVLFTAQKQKKFKTWQDGTMKYYSSNRKLVLTDEKGYNIDRKFYKGDVPNVGDELEFDGHIVTIESFESSEAAVPMNQPLPQQLQHQSPRRLQQPLQRQQVTPPPTPIIYHPPLCTPPQEPSIPSSQSSIPSRSSRFTPPSMILKKRKIKIDPEEEEAEKDRLEPMELCEAPDQPMQDIQLEPAIPPAQVPVQPNISSITIPATTLQKRVRVGLSKRTASALHQSTCSNRMPSPVSAYSSRVMPVPVPVSSNHTMPTPVPASSSHIMPSPVPSPPVNTNTVPANNSFTKASAVARDTLVIDTPQPLASSSSTSSSVSASNPSDQSSTSKPFKSPCADGNYTSNILQFPNSKKALTVLKSKKYPKRSKVVPTKFASPNLYKETFKKIIHEHLEILLVNCGVYFYSMYEKFGKNKQGADLERIIRSRGLPLYVQCHLKGDQRYQSDSRYHILLKGNREHYSKYNKDDIWVVSKTSSFESSQTFLARSTYFGPFSDGSLEIDCLSPRDVRIATKIWKEDNPIYALRTMSASTEFMMLDTLNDRLDQLPLLPYILTDNKTTSKKKKAMVVPPLAMPKLDHIGLTREDGIDIEAKIVETVKYYKLNQDQESVLRRVARSVIVCSGWNESTEHPLVLVHGVYGSGKSFLAAVIIIFIQDVIDTVNDKREPENTIQFKMLISSMTNVAVDQILQTLLKLGFDHFIRIGSMKKIAKSLLPYTAKARLSSNEELKELEQMLEDRQNSEEDSENIATAIQRFRKSESTSQIHATNVVGTTFMSSVFEVFNGVKFPFVLVDESSQLMEPLTMVPLARFSCNRLVMIGDPLQLPPTIATHAEEGKAGKGLDKTMFDRMIEMGHESIMLRTQYRCHPRISGISNNLFYDRRLLNGVTNEDRKPLIQGLPTLVFVDVGGTEQKSMRSQSYSNDTEIALSAHIIQTMLSFDISPTDLGVISLYKEQADKLSEYLSNNATTDSINSSKGVQISTVDAFQGGEKEVIVLSTVRTTESPFMDNQPRINVALTRAKRHLIILGNKSLFSMNELWSKVLWDCQEHCLNGKNFAALLTELKAIH